jgi:hypothetical protein
MEASMRNVQAAALPQLVDGVRQNAGFVRGFWCDDVEDPAVSLTFVVFETLDQARAFRQSVIGNAPAQAFVGVGRQRIRIVELKADA